MIKILHIVSSLSRGSGMMSFIMNYYNHIDREKVQFDFLYFNDRPPAYNEEIESMGGSVFKLGQPKFSKEYWKNVNKFFEERGGEYTAIHAHPIFASAMFSNVAKKNGITRIIQHSHSPKYSNNLISAVRNYIISLGFDYYATDYFSCSKEASNLFKFRSRKKVVIFRNAIDLEKFEYNQEARTNIRTKYDITDEIFLVGNIGRFTSEKNHLFLISLFSEIYKQNPQSRLMILGDGILKDKIRDLVKKMNLSDVVIFVGIQKDVPYYLSAFDTFILPSKFEGFGIVALESQASSLTTFCSDKVPLEVKLTDNFKSFSLTENKADIAKRILEYSTNRRDPVIKSNLVKYDINKEAKRMESYYINMNIGNVND